MFDVTIAAEIQKVSVSVVEADGLVMRTCRVTLAREFDDLIAASLGIDAKKALASLRTGGIEKVVMGIGRLRVQGKLRAIDDYVEIPVMRGLKATGVSAKDPSDGFSLPTLRMEFEFAFQEPAWAFLGRNIAAFAQITLKAVQEELGFDEPPSGDDDDEDASNTGAH